jgi:hypothetical protein
MNFKRIFSQILQALVGIAFIYFLFFNYNLKLAVLLGLANMIFWLIPEWYYKFFQKIA